MFTASSQVQRSVVVIPGNTEGVKWGLWWPNTLLSLDKEKTSNPADSTLASSIFKIRAFTEHYLFQDVGCRL